MDNEFLLLDRIDKIRAINEQLDLEHNAYLSFSGGKDSTILHYLLDIALPNNKIPRIYANTGIEYVDMVKFVKELAKNDDRFIIVNQTKNIKQTLEKYGYPFKNKLHSQRVHLFNHNPEVKTIKRYLNNQGFGPCPKILRYQFEEQGKYNYSDKCCFELKKDLLKHKQKELNKTIAITGIRAEEGGLRKNLTCLSFNNTKFHPLLVVNEEWEEWFIQKYNIQLCKLYYPPYNFVRTGCKGCPYNLNLQRDLETMAELLPNERKQCEILWKPVYAEYRRLGYRLKPSLLDYKFIKE